MDLMVSAFLWVFYFIKPILNSPPMKSKTEKKKRQSKREKERKERRKEKGREQREKKKGKRKEKE